MPFIDNGLVTLHRRAAKDMFVIEFISPGIAAECKPGQFLQVRPGNTNDPLLRRPLSIYDVDAGSGIISLLYRVAGKGTGLMTGLKVNDFIDVMGPLGRGFTLPERPENILLVGGGVGIAPLLYLGRVLRERQCQVKVLCGAGSAAQLVAKDQFLNLGITWVSATMDGSEGYTGVIDDVVLNTLEVAEEFDRVYTCGPEPMMNVVAKWAKVRNIWGEVSLEEHMACGVGACLGCARKRKYDDDGYVKVCKDGPVFNINEVELDQY